MNKTVVILVDNKKRDLPSCALIAHHLEEEFKIKCELQPLESWRACLAAFQPNFVLFNMLTAGHLSEFSLRLSELGVRVGVLPNEGILYDQEVLKFNAGKYHSNSHIDHFFCWNQIHRDSLLMHMNNFSGEFHVVGVPRFDYYFEPWKNVFTSFRCDFTGNDPNILVCTNFVFARYKDWPRLKVDKVFSPWKDRISKYKNYWELIEVNSQSRDNLFDDLMSILDDTNCFIVLKPQPAENHKPYQIWKEALSSEYKKRVKLLISETLWDVLPFCDLEIACETCTTSLEAWILNKPTIELLFQKHPVFFHVEAAQANLLCDSPKKLPGLIEDTLKNPKQQKLQELRRRHLTKWCASPHGNSSFKVAQIINNSIANMNEPKWNFTIQDQRRALKLKTKNYLGLAYGSDPWKLLKGFLPGITMDPTENKFIRPADVFKWKDLLLKVSRHKSKHNVFSEAP